MGFVSDIDLGPNRSVSAAALQIPLAGRTLGDYSFFSIFSS